MLKATGLTSRSDGVVGNANIDDYCNTACNNNNSNTNSKSMSFEETWNSMIDRLRAYKEKHGNCCVPSAAAAQRSSNNNNNDDESDDDDSNNDDPSSLLTLSAWVTKQRQLHMVNSLSKDKVDQLTEIGFVWKTLELSTSWDNMFQCLLVHKKTHGNCMVPTHFKSNPKLGRWVHVQRSNYQKNILTAMQVQRLENVGFEWSAHHRNTVAGGAGVNTAMCDTIESILQMPSSETNTTTMKPSLSTASFNSVGIPKNLFLRHPIRPYSPSSPRQQQQDDDDEEECDNCNNKATAKLQSFLSESIDNKIDMNLLSWDMAISSDISKPSFMSPATEALARATSKVQEEEESTTSSCNRRRNHLLTNAHNFKSDGALLSSLSSSTSSSLLRSRKRQKFTDLSKLSQSERPQKRRTSNC